MNFLLMLLASVFSAVSSASIRGFQTKLNATSRQLQFFQFVYILLDSLIFFSAAGFVLPANPIIWLWAVGFALCMFTSSIGTVQSYRYGPMSLSSIIISCNVLMPILAGCLLYQEKLSIIHMFGIAFLLATVILSSIGPKGEKQEFHPIWFLYVLMAFLGNGFGAVILSSFGKIYQGAGNQSFMAAAFFLSALLLFLYYLFGGIRHREKAEPIRPLPLFLVITAICAITCYAVNALLLFLAGRMSAALLYPIYTGVSSVLICLTSWLVFRERMTKKKLLNITLGLIAVILLNL